MATYEKTGDPAIDKDRRRLADEMEEAEEQGYIGVATDPTPNENYTVAGVTSGAETPETMGEADPLTGERPRVKPLDRTRPEDRAKHVERLGAINAERADAKAARAQKRGANAITRTKASAKSKKE